MRQIRLKNLAGCDYVINSVREYRHRVTVKLDPEQSYVVESKTEAGDAFVALIEYHLQLIGNEYRAYQIETIDPDKVVLRRVRK